MASAFGLLDYDWDTPLSDEDRDRMLGSIVATVRKWRLQVPFLLFLEANAPLGHMAGQGLIGFAPFVAPILPGGVNGVQRLSKLLEKPQNVQRLMDMLSEESDAARK